MDNQTSTQLPFEDILGVQFKDFGLLLQALTHRSYVNEYDGDLDVRDNERMEFLGDAVIDIIVANMLYRRFPEMSEGELTQLRAALVKTEALAMLATEIHLGDYLRIGKGEEHSGGRTRSNNLCRGFEAVIGAMYIDSGIETVEECILPRIERLLAYVLENNLHIDARSELQEKIQAKLSITPSYRVAGADGPDHAKEFRVEVVIGSTIIGTGIGTSKRTAAQSAARAALVHLQERGFPESDDETSNGREDSDTESSK